MDEARDEEGREEGLVHERYDRRGGDVHVMQWQRQERGVESKEGAGGGETMDEG